MGWATIGTVGTCVTDASGTGDGSVAGCSIPLSSGSSRKNTTPRMTADRPLLDQSKYFIVPSKQHSTKSISNPLH
jgi:hypothetical protein